MQVRREVVRDAFFASAVFWRMARSSVRVVAGLQTGSFSCLLIAGRWSLTTLLPEQCPLNIAGGGYHIIYRVLTIIEWVLVSKPVRGVGK